jgi:hypothetical protein
LKFIPADTEADATRSEAPKIYVDSFFIKYPVISFIKN